MKVEVQLFAVTRQVAGRPRIEVELTAGATVAELRDKLKHACPALTDLLPTLIFAVEDQYLADCQEIPQGRSVACIPPVSGG